MKKLFFLFALLIFAPAALAGTYTTKNNLYKPAVDETGWGNLVHNNWDIIDTFSPQHEVDALLSFGNGTEFTQATIEAALVSIGTNTPTTLLLRPGTWVISSNADWSAYTNVILCIVPGAVLQVATGTLTTLPGFFIANLEQIFVPIGTGKIVCPVFQGKALPEWWGGKGDGVTDNTAAIQAAVLFFAGEDREGIVYFTRGEYLTDQINIPDAYSHTSFMASASHAVKLIYSGAGGPGTSIINYESGKSFGIISNIRFRGYDTNNATGGIAENILVFGSYMDQMFRMTNCHFQMCYGDAISFIGPIINTHLDHLRFDAVGGFCFNWPGNAAMEARLVTVNSFTVDNAISGAFATRATTLGYYDGIHWGKGIAYMANVDGAHFTFEDARIELDKPFILESRPRAALFFTDVPSGSTTIKIKNLGGFFHEEDGGVVVYAAQNRTSFVGEGLFFYYTSAIFETAEGKIIPRYGDYLITYEQSKQRENGVQIQGNVIEFRDESPPDTVYNAYTRGSVVFNNTPTKGENIGWIATEPTTGYGIPAEPELDGAAIIINGSPLITVTAAKMKNFFLSLSVTLIGAGPVGANITTYITAIDIANHTITVNDVPSTSVNPATINAQKPIFVRFGTIDLSTTFSWNPASLADGVGETSGDIAITGASLGDFVLVGCEGESTAGLLITGYISATDTAKIRIQNETGGVIDLGSQIWNVKVIKH